MRHSIFLVLLLGFELSYYLLIVQTGLATHYHSDLHLLLPLFLGGVAGTIIGGQPWGSVTEPIHKVIAALVLQLVLSFFYPDYFPLTLGLLGLAVGLMAPLSIYLFKRTQQTELLFALAVAYGVGTYGFTSYAENREAFAVIATSISLLSALFLWDYRLPKHQQMRSYNFFLFIPLMLWILLDSNLFETLSRNPGMDIWSHYTYTIMLSHFAGLILAYFSPASQAFKQTVILAMFIASYGLYYLHKPWPLAMMYPITISYYNFIVFSVLSKENSLQTLSLMMVFIGWIASGFGLAIALSKVLY